MMQNLMYTSVFVNSGQRFAQSSRIPSVVFRAYARLVKHRWKRHRYPNSLDIRAIRMAHKYYSPVDFKPIPPRRKRAST